MRLSRRVSVLERREDQRLSNLRTRKKHKRLDAICETVYNRNHRGVKTESNEYNAEGDEAELRRSTRVRRAPAVLDASPPPPKKRRRVEFRSGTDSVGKGKRKDWVKNDSPCSTSGNVEKEPGSWKARLRARVKNRHFRQMQRGDSSPRGKRRLFGESKEFHEGKAKNREYSDKDEIESGMSTVVKSKRPGRIKASNVLKTAHQESGSSSDKGDSSETKEVGVDREKDEVDDEKDKDEFDGEKDKNEAEEHIEKDEINVFKASDEKNPLHFRSGVDSGSECEINDGNATQVAEKEADEATVTLEKDEVHVFKSPVEKNPLHFRSEVESVSECEIKDGNATRVAEKEADEAAVILQSEDCTGGDNLEAIVSDMQVELPMSIAEGENQRDSAQVGGVSTGQMEDRRSNENSLDDENASKNSRDQLGKLHLRVGRRCGLCGTGTDGKPPKQLAEDSIGSDHEAYSGSSASEEVNYDIWDGFGDEPGWLGRLLGPINDRYGIAGIWVHQHCAVWSPEVYFAGLGCLKNVRAALCRGRVLKCTRCRRPGATIGCRVDRCPKTYHLPCARANGCIFDHRKFLIACTDHRHLFQPHGNQYLHKIKKMKAKKMKLEMRRMSSDVWRKDLEAEEKWLENCGEDEEFLKRESKRLHRDLLRIAPVYIGGSNFDNEAQFQGWESVAGLQDVIRCLKEVVILPLLYPEFFSNMGLTPPRGVLLHGYPGTGKTLVVRALIGSCARGDKRIAYFARKGADCLGKYVGDAERQLRLLFQVAEKSQPSIIFFDEIDGLAPCRTRQQDQTHNSVVSTLLALLDGLKSRGSVVVIGATNRPDAVDPALRRPGRFDREIYFPLPSVHDREAILSLHTRKWPKPVTGSLLNQVARRTVGFAGADLQALCTQAAIIALRRNCPFQEILSAAEKKAAHGKRPTLPTFAVEERDWLEALRHAPPPCSQRGAEMAANDVVSSPLHKHLIPCLLQPLSIFLVSLYRDERILLPSPLLKAATLVRSVVVSALDKKKLPSDNLWFHVHDVLQEADVLTDIETKLSHCGIVIGEASDSNSNIGDEDTNHDKFKSRCPKVQQISTHPHLLHNVICASEKKLGFWLLISGSPRSGQRYLASCLLHCFTGNLEIQKIDLATISQEGQGDLMQGLTRILMKCASIGSSLIYMPRIDLWAIETCGQLNGNEDDSSIVNSELPDQEEGKLSEMAVSEDVSEKTATTCHGNDSDSSIVNSVLRGQEEGKLSEMAVSEDVLQKTSLIWNSFVEQVESISVASSLTILATSDLPFQALPQRIRQFFKSEKSDCRSSSPLEETIPRFSVHLDGDLNRDSVITLSAIELSKDLVQQFVQLIHHRVHVHSSPCTEDKSCDTLELYANTCRPANEHEKALFPERSFMKFSSPPNSRPSKGKSNLLLAISSLGYQILRYPHFAELCWVTSKLKEGPCTDIGGPWKGWPFNSCIVRPDNSSERVAVPCSSSNIKSRENFGLVRGLIAVGLLAYRGMYTTLRDVSSEVRKVFEFLADEINAKIQAGKDSYQYIRLLSQMAYLEDMLNSWAYTLRSLEEDAQATVPTSKLTDLRSLDSDMPFEDNTQHKDGCEPDFPAKSSIGVVEGNTQKFDLNKTVEDNDPNSKEIIVTEEPPEQMFCHRSTSHLNEQDGNNTEQYSPGNPGNHLSYDVDFGSSRANGFAYTGSVYTEEDGSCSGNMGNAKSSSFEEACNQHNDLTMDTHIPSTDGKPSSDEGQCPVDNTSSAGNETRVSNDSGVTCFYRCCSECLLSLRDTMGKILIHELGLRDSGFTVEDAHDLIVSLSTNLHSYLRKMFTAETSAIPIEGKLRQDKISKLFGYQQTESCQCKDSEDGSMMMMMECRCHSRSKKGENTITSPSQNFLEIDLKFICKDGVLSFLDPEDNASFHCKFETLCLCSLIEWIVMTKQPSGGYDFFAA